MCVLALRGCGRCMYPPPPIVQLTSEKGEMERRRTMMPGSSGAEDPSPPSSRRPSVTGETAPKGWKLLSGNQVRIEPSLSRRTSCARVWFTPLYASLGCFPQVVLTPVSCRHLTPAKYHGPTHPYVVCSLEKQTQVRLLSTAFHLVAM